MWKMRLDSLALTGWDSGQRSSLMGVIHVRFSGPAAAGVFAAFLAALAGALVAFNGRTLPAGCCVRVPGSAGGPPAGGAASEEVGSAATSGSGGRAAGGGAPPRPGGGGG